MNPGDLRLTAYLVPADPASPPHAGDLRDYLAAQLPDYLIPSYTVVLDRLPLTATGKLDRNALPRPDRESGTTGRYAPPRDEREATIASIWTSTLGLTQAGIYDDFFDLGGHSLLATRLVARISEAFRIDLPLRTIFTHRTIAALATAIGQAQVTAPDIDPLVPAPESERSVLSFAQQRLWFMDQLQPGSTAYHVTRRYRIRGQLDTRALTAAFTQVVTRHTPLRSRFSARDGQPVLIVDPPESITLGQHNLSAEPDPYTAALDVARRDRDQPFDLATGPLTRARLLQLAPDDHILALAIHHAAFDGQSVTIFERDLATAYHAALADRAPNWVPLQVDYPDYAAWQRRRLTGPHQAVHAAYWRTALTGATPALQLPTDHPRPPLPTFASGAVPIAIPATSATTLRQLAREHHATMFMVTLAAYQVLLTRYTRDPDVTIGCPFGGRTHPHLDYLIGFFVSSLPLHADLTANPTFTELLTQTRTTALDAFDHQDLPFEQIIEEVNPPRDTSRNPLTQAWFQLARRDQRRPLELDGLQVEPVSDDAPLSTRFDLELQLWDTDEGELRGELIYATDLFEAASMRQFAAHYVTLLGSIATSPDAPISELAHITPAESTTLLRTWNATATPPPPHATIAAWFDHQAAQTPNAPALRDDRTTLTYCQLATQANQLAHELRHRGFGPETPAAVLLPRGTQLITTILAILKAGGAYLPLDPHHPPDRLAYMLTTAQATLTITTTSLTSHLPAGTPYLAIDTTSTSHHPCTPPPDLTTPDTLAYLIYTSGSTGRPKGVAVATSSLLNLVHWHITTYQAPGRPSPTK